MDDFLQGLGIVVGVFVGVVGGTAVVLLTAWVNQRRGENQLVRNLRFEFDLNIKKIDVWLEELTSYRNAVNANNLALYAGYFDLSRIVYVTANNMFVSGALYKYLDHGDIGDLQVITSELSLHGENYMNNQITQNRANFNQAVAAADVDFWERKLKGHRQTFERLHRKLR